MYIRLSDPKHIGRVRGLDVIEWFIARSCTMMYRLENSGGLLTHGISGVDILVFGAHNNVLEGRLTTGQTNVNTNNSSYLACAPCAKQALTINSANVLGGSSEPNGFCRVDKRVWPFSVAEAASKWSASTGLDFRVTLSWKYIAAISLSVKQLLHDLDLVVSSPSGTM